MEILHHVAGLYHSISHIQHTLSTAHDEIMTSAFERATETAEFLRSKLPGHLARPRVAVVCGSGLGGLAKTVNPGTEVWEYKDVPNFPLSTGEREYLRVCYYDDYGKGKGGQKLYIDAS